MKKSIDELINLIDEMMSICVRRLLCLTLLIIGVSVSITSNYHDILIGSIIMFSFNYWWFD